MSVSGDVAGADPKDEELTRDLSTEPVSVDQPVQDTDNPNDVDAAVSVNSEFSRAGDGSGIYEIEPADNAFRIETTVSVEPAVVEQLSKGFMERFLPALEKSKTSVTEILTNQTVLIDTLEQENAKFDDCRAYTNLLDMMTKARNYHNKLLVIRRDMTNLHEKAARLKKRALKLQQQKHREVLQRAHQQEKEMEREQMLTARVAQPDKT